MKKAVLFVLILALVSVFTAGSFAEEAETLQSVKSGDWEYVVLEDGTAEIAGYTGEETSVSVPQELDGIPVTAVGRNAFEKADKVMDVILPEGITTIGRRAFSLCRGIKSVTLPSTLAVIGDYAFSNCWQMAGIDLPDGLTTIGEYAFSGCSRLEEITVPDGVTELGANPFNDCASLKAIRITPDQAVLEEKDGVFFSRDGRRLIIYPDYLPAESYTIPEGTEVIADSAFFGNSNLYEIIIPDSVTTLENDAFSCCSEVREIKLPDSIASMGDGALSFMALTEARLPEGLGRISDRLFEGCDVLETVYIPAGVTEAGANPFSGCESLTAIEVDEGNTALEVIDGALFSRADRRLVSLPLGLCTEEYAVPEGTEIIGEDACSENLYLQEVTFPEGLKEISFAAFADCKGLGKVVLPDSIEKVGAYAFAFNPLMSEVSIPASLTDIDENAFVYSGKGDIVSVR